MPDRDGVSYDDFLKSVDALNDLLESVEATPEEIQKALTECQDRCGRWMGAEEEQKT